MKTLGIAVLGLVVIGFLIGTLRASYGPKELQGRPQASAPAADQPIEILHAQPFVLDQGWVHEWRREKPLVSSGVILVLRTDPELVRPRNTFEPVLYVGAQTAERVNGPENGNLVVIVPAPVDARGRVALELATAPIWFGTPELPERVDAAAIARELALARSRGAGPAAQRSRTARAGSDAIHARDRADLDPYLADLIELYSPEEVDLVRGLRVPVTR